MDFLTQIWRSWTNHPFQQNVGIQDNLSESWSWQAASCEILETGLGLRLRSPGELCITASCNNSLEFCGRICRSLRTCSKPSVFVLLAPAWWLLASLFSSEHLCLIKNVKIAYFTLNEAEDMVYVYANTPYFLHMMTMTFTMIFTWISSLPCLFLFKFKILNQKGILWMVLLSHESKLAIFPQKKPDPTNQVKRWNPSISFFFHLGSHMVSKPEVSDLFGIAHFYDLVVVKVREIEKKVQWKSFYG